MSLVEKMYDSIDKEVKDKYSISIEETDKYGKDAKGFSVCIDPKTRISEEIKDILEFGVLSSHKLFKRVWKDEEEFIENFKNIINTKIAWYEDKIREDEVGVKKK